MIRRTGRSSLSGVGYQMNLVSGQSYVRPREKSPPGMKTMPGSAAKRATRPSRKKEQSKRNARKRARQTKPPAPPLQTHDLFWWRRRFRLRVAMLAVNVREFIGGDNPVGAELIHVEVGS